MTFEEKLELARKFNKQIIAGKKAGQIATKNMILNNEIPEEELKDLVALYPEFEVAVSYEIGDIIQYQNKLYEVIQAHTSQADWTPDISTSLFTSKMPSGVIPEWTQPTGAHDAYNIGDKVTFEGQVYESTIDANTYSPTDYPAGWNLVG